MARIAIAGFHHETNTFAPVKADLEAFATVAAYPRMPRGADMPQAMAGLNVGVAGFLEAAGQGHTFLPSVWAAAVPSAQVTDEAFETIAGMIVDDIAAALPVDAVYLCLHGAMVTDSHEDGEGELLSRVRALVGPDVPIVASLDLHCNTTRRMVETSDALVAYRTYPHVDMAETGRRAWELLRPMLEDGWRPAKALRRTDFLIPLVWQCTLIAPANAIYARFPQLEGGTVRSVSFTPGFPAADIAECGPAVLAYAEDQAGADAAADAILADIVAARHDWNGRLFSPDEAIAHALANYRGKPFVLADTQDNPGAGGAGDTVGVLEALVRRNAPDAVLGVLYDPETAAAAHAAGVGATIERAVGEVTAQPGHTPFHGHFTVEALSDGTVIGTGPMKRGTTIRLGPTALLRIGGTRLVVASGKAQANDQAYFRHLGVDPTKARIVVVKSSVHFRADFQDMAEEVLVVVSPGPNLADHLALPYRRLRPGLLLTPDGPAFAG